LGLVLGINASWSGCKLTLGENANSTTNAYVACSPKRVEDIGANGTPDIIICFVGTNDFGYNAVIGDYDARSAIPELSSAVSTTTPQNEFADAYAVMINRIRTTYPTAKLFCCTILDRGSAFPPTNNVPATMSDYNRKIIELCNNMGVKVIRTHECGISVWNTGTYLQDGLHPKSNGMELISNCVVKELIKNF
jgi:lysophospholipase L1-like esterase